MTEKLTKLKGKELARFVDTVDSHGSATDKMLPYIVRMLAPPFKLEITASDIGEVVGKYGFPTQREKKITDYLMDASALEPPVVQSQEISSARKL